MDTISEDASTGVTQGAKQMIDGRLCVYYDGYWIKAYASPGDTLAAKKQLIEALTRRLFNHVEYGLNIPGRRLDEARAAYDRETDPELKRVKGAMLAGALFNRATEMFTKLVEIQALGVEIQSDNALMRECGRHLQEALQLGKLVLHRSGEEGIDELWGEPFRVFSIPVEAFYESRYIKIAQTMRDIDRIAATLIATFADLPQFAGIAAPVAAFATAAKRKSETLRTDPDIFDVWSTFVVAGERLLAHPWPLPAEADVRQRQDHATALALLRQGRDLVFYITRARTPMPKSTREFIERCETYRRQRAEGA